MLTTINNYFSLMKYQSDISTSKSLEPWEKALFNSCIIVGITLLAYTTFAQSNNMFLTNFDTDFHSSLYL
ncbi:hypothetical protein RhiirA5_353853 [Rhizophagus irregularis]|uniref:Uncharacterized protein n=4 Tax=Rhizophagus irregularis TaxID=588596 RepID=A0A2I1DXA6_9GLOM|nr:hypothetical protein RirG_023980 [Rhizophagus irregularis DAOM 197198w]PKC11728.1 hypothetical protein RhiirA5_353853 [Rhizophagus irregularis]RGB37403.1 hypothetical protein C1646_756928 [Rhizophagus diaphanus] [Rhizophagus sp. MUCL 43196]GBC12048.1 hypothetical protein GLOIN_2v1547607 [Rhizophagus irregularis DAOM 181602=DAOM 197198]PKC71893.1 hypothetical protein RhiirA1_412536 [Rhizophagus irregularis]